MTERTLRRKLQKKKKHKPYRKCPKCGDRMDVSLKDGNNGGYTLFKHCGTMQLHYGEWKCLTINGCGYFEELFLRGGGTGRHIPHELARQGTGR